MSVLMMFTEGLVGLLEKKLKNNPHRETEKPSKQVRGKAV